MSSAGFSTPHLPPPRGHEDVWETLPAAAVELTFAADIVRWTGQVKGELHFVKGAILLVSSKVDYK